MPEHFIAPEFGVKQHGKINPGVDTVVAQFIFKSDADLFAETLHERFPHMEFSAFALEAK